MDNPVDVRSNNTTRARESAVVPSYIKDAATPESAGPALHLILRDLRMTLGYSHRELARRSGLDAALICRMEAGKECLLSTYERAAEALGGRTTYAISVRSAWNVLLEARIHERQERWERQWEERRQARRATRRSR
ncbi:MAG: helix-turn-helix domain-containing protein [Elusimicrobia bacterium]|nr:helix-turn-helix domain-containing protein [Elusimicrobiota bacterium]